VTFTFQALIHFSDWVVGHAHLVMFGVFTLWLMGIMTYLFPRLWHRPWYSQALCEWHYWLSTIGVVLMFGDLVLAGILQGYWWGSLQPWENSIDGSRPFWIFRVFAGLTMFAGQLCFYYNIYRTWKAPVPAEEQAELTVALT
jgi:cytochrome c oxidase cbb3-type subunit 1